MSQPTDTEAYRLLVAVGVDDPERFIEYGPDRIRAAIYRMRFEQKGKGWLIHCLKNDWGCPPPPDWWNPWLLQTIDEQRKMHGARASENLRAEADYERTKHEALERWSNARPLTQPEFETMWAELSDKLLDQMTAGEVAILNRLRDERDKK